MNNDNIRITYPDSEKVYMQGSLHPDVKVGMRKVSLTPTVTVKDGQKVMTENPPVYIYDTSGPYSDPSADIDLRRGLPRLREKWILQREVEQLPQVSSEYGRERLADKSLDHLRFEHIRLPYRAKKGSQITQMYYAKQGIVTPERRPYGAANGAETPLWTSPPETISTRPASGSSATAPYP